MNKAGIVDAVHAVLGGTKVQAEQAVEEEEVIASDLDVVSQPKPENVPVTWQKAALPLAW